MKSSALTTALACRSPHGAQVVHGSRGMSVYVCGKQGMLGNVTALGQLPCVEVTGPK